MKETAPRQRASELFDESCAIAPVAAGYLLISGLLMMADKEGQPT
jgi:hypothetical protein